MVHRVVVCLGGGKRHAGDLMIVCVAASAAMNTCWKQYINTAGQYVSCTVQVHMRYSSAQVNMQQFLEGIAGPGKAELVARATEVLKTNDIEVHVSRGVCLTVAQMRCAGVRRLHTCGDSCWTTSARLPCRKTSV